ncbi:MAG TPA: hypothetical protein PL193_14525, partial [Xanthobacteraceae bacterium]|nr:hypothetical protein [Xanthobacteraceae bacterium]
MLAVGETVATIAASATAAAAAALAFVAVLLCAILVAVLFVVGGFAIQHRLGASDFVALLLFRAFSVATLQGFAARLFAALASASATASTPSAAAAVLIGRAITLIESRNPQHTRIANEIILRLLPYT